jgi:TonB family protein
MNLPDPAPPDIGFSRALLQPAHANPWSYGTSIAINGAILAALLCLGMHSHNPPYGDPAPGTHVNLSDFQVLAKAARDALHGGGGGGNHDLVDPTTGRLPDRSNTPLMHPQVPLLDNPQFIVNPSIAVPPDVKLPDNPNPTNLGVYHSSNRVILSSGPGAEAGIGSGSKGGVGPGHGIGWGPGTDQGAGGSVYTPGRGGVTAPIPLFQPDAEFSDEARRVKYQGVCMITVIVDAQGNPVNPRVVQPLGMGLDEKALDAVRRYRFKPARKDGKAVPVMITIAVNFRLF